MSSLGIDIGTTSTCAVVFDPDSGVVASVSRKNDSAIGTGVPWERCQDVKRIESIVSDLVAGMVEKYPGIEEIGLAGQMHGILYVDASGKAVSPLYTWQDERGNLPFEGEENYASYLSGISGYRLSAGYGLVTHFYNVRNGLVPANAARLCTIMDYAAMFLTGAAVPLTDPSNAAGLGMFDKQGMRFDIPAATGLDMSFLPPVSVRPDVVGMYRGKIPVVTAVGDNQASFLGSVRSREDSVHITVGTSSQISVYSTEYREYPYTDTRPLPGGGYIVVGAALCGGYTLSVLNRFYADIVGEITGETVSEDMIYDRMSRVPFAATSESCPVIRTSFAGTRADPFSRGEIRNISTDNLTFDNMVRGFMQGICEELYSFYEQFPEKLRAGRKRLVGSGSGLRKNPLLRKIMEERFALSMEMSLCTEEAALGAAVCARMGTGRG